MLRVVAAFTGRCKTKRGRVMSVTRKMKCDVGVVEEEWSGAEEARPAK